MNNLYNEYLARYPNEYPSEAEIKAMLDDLEAKLQSAENYYAEHKQTIDYLKKWVVESTKVSWQSVGVLLKYYYDLNNNPAQALLTVKMAAGLIAAGVIMINYKPATSNKSWSDFKKENDTNTP